MEQRRLHLVLFIVSLLFVSIKCWILRLPCKSEASFSVSFAGHALQHNILMKLTLPLEECKNHCVFTANCQAINHKSLGIENCELNSETKETKRGDLIAKPGWTYYATNQETRLIGSVCQREDPCGPNRFCVDDCRCPGYRCVDCYEHAHLSYCSSLNQQSCNSLYALGNTTSGVYHLPGIGDHYCMMGGGCGSGGWTLAMKTDGSKNTFQESSSYWTNKVTYNNKSVNLNDGDAKFNAFSNVAISKVCIGMKTREGGMDSSRWLTIPKSSFSLLGVFLFSESFHTDIDLQKWKGLIYEHSRPLQENCHRQGFNIKNDIWRTKIWARIGILGNNENDCASVDSGIGIGRSSWPYSGGIRLYPRQLIHATAKQAFIFIQ